MIHIVIHIVIRLQDFNDLRKGVAAVRRGEAPTTAAGSAGSSSSRVRCAPQRGAPGHENPEPKRDALQPAPN